MATPRPSLSGAVLLGQHPSPWVTVVCRSCQRRGRFATARLIERFGADAPMPDVLRAIIAESGCALAREVSGLERCQAVFDLSALT